MGQHAGCPWHRVVPLLDDRSILFGFEGNAVSPCALADGAVIHGLQYHQQSSEQIRSECSRRNGRLWGIFRGTVNGRTVAWMVYIIVHRADVTVGFEVCCCESRTWRRIGNIS